MVLQFIKETAAALPDFSGPISVPFTRDTDATLIVVYFACETGELDATTGLKWAAGNMTFAVAATQLDKAHGEFWIFKNPGPGQTDITFTSTGGTTGGLWSVFEFSGEEIDGRVIGFVGATNGLSNLFSTDWTAERQTSIIVDAVRIRNKSLLVPGAGQILRLKMVVATGKSHGSTESAIAPGSGPALYTSTKIRHYAHCLLEIKELLSDNPATVEAQIGPMTTSILVDQERRASVEAQIGPLTTTIAGNQERKATVEAQIGALVTSILTVVDRNATIQARMDPLTTDILVTTDAAQNFAQIEAQIGALTASILGNQERRALIEAQIGALTTDIDVVVINGAIIEAQIAALTATIVAHPVPGATIEAQIGALTTALEVQIEHDATIDPAQIGALTTTISANAGTATAGFDSESKVFLQTFDSRFTKLRARIVQNGTGGIRVPVDAHSVVIRRIT